MPTDAESAAGGPVVTILLERYPEIGAEAIHAALLRTNNNVLLAVDALDRRNESRSEDFSMVVTQCTFPTGANMVMPAMR
jgi:hypothetical protein